MQSEPASAAIEPRSRGRDVAWTLIALGGMAAAIVWLAVADERPAEAAAAIDPIAIAMPGPTSFAEVETAAETEAPAPASTGGDDEIQLCGGHWVRAGPDGKPAEDALQAIVARSLDDVSAVALGLMAASPSPRVQAAAHYYRAGRIAIAGLTPADARAEGASHRDALARLAQTTDDAQVYAWAYRACRAAAEGSPGVCMQVGAAQWTRVDPDNAESWLAAAEEARRRHDDAALDDAMFHVAAAERHHPGRAALAAAVAEYTPQDDRSLIGTSMAVGQAIGIEAAAASDWQGVSDYCSVKATTEANRRETCERVATVLADRSSSVAARDLGIAVGRRLGWSAERLETLTQQRDAEAMAARLQGSDPRRVDPLACAAMRSTIERVRAQAEFGEIEALRRELAATGRSIGTLAAEARRAASAASAASAALIAQR
jgi:hypothetical protein